MSNGERLTVVTRTERGWAATYNNYWFRRNTLLQKGEVRIVILSLGGVDSKTGGPGERLGSGYFYESMAFHAVSAPSLFFDEDRSRPVNFRAPRFLNKRRDDQANDMHECVVEEITRRMEAGEFDTKR